MRAIVHMYVHSMQHAHALENLKDHLREGASVLDVGSGSGYLAVCFAYMVCCKGTFVWVSGCSICVCEVVCHIHTSLSPPFYSKVIIFI